MQAILEIGSAIQSFVIGLDRKLEFIIPEIAEIPQGELVGEHRLDVFGAGHPDVVPLYLRTQGHESQILGIAVIRHFERASVVYETGEGESGFETVVKCHDGAFGEIFTAERFIGFFIVRKTIAGT